MRKYLPLWSIVIGVITSLTIMPDLLAQTSLINTFNQEHIYFGGENRRAVRDTFNFPDA